MPPTMKYPIELLERATRPVFESGRPIVHVPEDLGLPRETLGSTAARRARNFADGTNVKLTAAPAIGSTFAGFSGAGCTGTGPCTVTLTSDTTVTATFTATVGAAPTTLVANPYFFYLTPSATLKSHGTGVPGQLITFTANGKQVCTATTNTNGFGECSQRFAGFIMVIRAGGYHATFAGTPTLKPSSATADLFGITFGRRHARHGTRPRH